MQGNEQRRGGLRHWIIERWTPLFTDETETESLTAEEFAAACDWARLRAAGVVTPHEEPLGIAGLRLSAIFPRHLLRRRDDGRLVPIAFDDAVALVRLTLAQEGRSPERTYVLDGTDAVNDLEDGRDEPEELIDAATAERDGSVSGDEMSAELSSGGDRDETTDQPPSETRGRLRFRRRRD